MSKRAGERATRWVTRDWTRNLTCPMIQHQRHRFEIPAKGQTLAALFGAIEGAKVELCVEDYSVAQTSLEQVFGGGAGGGGDFCL